MLDEKVNGIEIANKQPLTKPCHSNINVAAVWEVSFFLLIAIIRYLSTDGAGPVVTKHAQISMFFKGKIGCLNEPCHNYRKNTVISAETIGWFIVSGEHFFCWDSDHVVGV